MPSLEKYIDALKYGLIGLGFLLALFSFWLLLAEQRKEHPRGQNFDRHLRIYGFLVHIDGVWPIR